MPNIQYANTDINSDKLSDLPTNQNQPSKQEIQIIDNIFKKHSSTIGNITKEFKDSIYIGIIFFALSLPQTDDLIRKYISITQKSVYILLLVKSIFFIVMFWVIKNSNLIRKQ